ncbi:transketolase [Blochmannia endosymbiont of Colobopsis nipponica]|uniref:transketolase n=1 Tax=Blochmannia endosymbiont of Colobopsis nipponica TaxID=2681987 RepID=UPI001783DB8D|nr:transketolase [Blochmannia endosymbiont of Colobopsis nipponica]QOI10953.1 transketolase [Blochmannia endosymbiont of Colobopsis nipponica]
MKLRKKLANAIRFLSIDAIQKAESGHPGAPMGMADIAEVLWRDYMNHNPKNPLWLNRDRFVLSNGHASMLLYSILHLTGYNLSIEELKNFRQLNSKTPGHPEFNHDDGIETTTGPLGQGVANAVGLAIGEHILSSQFNRDEFNIIDHYTYVFLGDGCMMEGISHEACSLAGTMKLGKLIAFYDSNGISIDGKINRWFKDDTEKRFKAYGWQVISDINGHNSNDIKAAIENARSVTNKPTLIICKTIIAFGSPKKSGTSNAHGAPLGKEEIAATRIALNWKSESFIIPDDIYQHWDAKKKGQEKELNWQLQFNNYAKKYPILAKELCRRIQKKLPKDWQRKIKKFIKFLQDNPKTIATRQSSQNTLEILGTILPELLGGSADLTPSNLTTWSKSVSITDNHAGNYIHYGVREFGMTAIGNGIANYGGFIPYTATFLTFIDYARNAVRMAALMKSRHIMIYTHDSIGVGEDGPTHQPIEQLASLRMTPNINCWRPCDQVETAIAWKNAIENCKGPTALILSRQNLKQQMRNEKQLEYISRGGYILKDCQTLPELILIATGSEVELAVEAYQKLKNEGFNIRVVSMPSTYIFEQQDQIYKKTILPDSVKARIAIEAGSTDCWYKYVGLDGIIIGMKTFGKSAPAKKLFELFGFTVENIILKAHKLLKK